MAERIEWLYIHCSGGDNGNENLINHWHKLRRFMTMWNGYQISTGYNMVVLNGYPHDRRHYYPFLDGSVETARPDWLIEAAVKGANRNSVHVCLIGRAGYFTPAQTKTLMAICHHYVKGGLAVENVLGHYEYWTRKNEQPMKSCPGINMAKFRNDLMAYIEKKTVAKQVPIRIRPRVGVVVKALGAWNLMLGGGRA